jgi:RHS repeat-associated protein
MAPFRLIRIALLCALALPPGVCAQQPEPTVQTEQAKLIKAPDAVGTLGTDLFGDKINFHNGALEFSQTDVSLPGNNKLPVSIGRRLVTGGRGTEAQGLFRNWDLEIPHIHGMFFAGHGWLSRLSSGTDRCTSFARPPEVYQVNSNNRFRATEFWNGNLLYVPGVGDQEMLKRAASNTANPAPIVTTSHWQIRCIPLTGVKADTPPSEKGEGFLVTSPDGTTYRFDWLASRPMSTISKPVNPHSVANNPDAGNPEDKFDVNGLEKAPAPSPDGDDSAMFSIARVEVWILPTVITDRYGNTVRYSYDATDRWKLTSITGADANASSADGSANTARVLSLDYVPGTHFVSAVRDGTRTWRYDYIVGPSQYPILSQVTLPDNSRWILSGIDGSEGYPGLSTMHIEYLGEPDASTEECDPQPRGLNAPLSVGTMVHPSGAIGRFEMDGAQHGRNGVPYQCISDTGFPPGRNYYPRYYDMYALKRKTISGPGLPTMTWSTTYDTFYPAWNPCLSCISKVSVTDPQGKVTRYHFGSTFNVNEGMLLAVDVDYNAAANSALRTTTYSYRNGSRELPNNQIGVSEQDRGDAGMNSRARPQDSKVIAQQGVNFNWAVANKADGTPYFDRFFRPLQVVRFSRLDPSRPTTNTFTRTEETTYYDHTVKWVLGQIASVREVAGNRVMVSNTFDSTTANHLSTSRFGQLEQSMTYYADGSLATRKDGKGQTTAFSYYKRGIPRKIDYPTGHTERVEVNDIGKITSATDANGFVTTFGYDAMGRVNRVTPPAGDTVAWNPTTITFQQVDATELGLAPGHWRQIIATGNGRTINYFDALWRPVYTHKYDNLAATATSMLSHKRYDHEGKVTFSAYPKRTQAELTAGVHTEYDALGRPTVVGTNSEHGVLYSGHNYGNGFVTTYTTARQHNTAFRYQVFDDPAEHAATSITYPHNITLTIGRDIFGKATYMSRSDGVKSTTRSYVYDSKQRLCKLIERETGATVLDYDAAGNIAWKAGGLDLPSTTSCDTASVPAARKAVFGYDAQNRLLSTTFGDGSPTVSQTYTPDGLIATATSAGAVWTYTYNRRRLLEGERLAYGGANYQISRRYDVNGSPNLLTYPDNTSIDYAPNSIGQPTKVGTYANAITFHPNGAIATFNYGNGIGRSLTQNVRGLPLRSNDVGVINDVYAYDANANVASITDQQENGSSNRTMGYDQLDRLTSVLAPNMWGEARFTYDGLDNLTSSTVTHGPRARTLTHNYATATNRLSSLAGTAAYAMAYEYDAQGNVTKRGAQSFVFDIANRMKQATGKATYIYDGHGRRVSVVGTDGVNRLQLYSKDGQLLYVKTGTNSIRKHIYLHNHTIAEVDGSGVQYQHTDALGSPIARTNASKAIISRTRYEPYGGIHIGASPTLGYTGHAYDSDTGLTYMQQRYQDPLAGRFLSIDPVTTDANTGGSFNRYAYANDSPYKYVDPDGRIVFLALIPVALKTIDATLAVAEVYMAAQTGGASAAGVVLAENAAMSVVPGGKTAQRIAKALDGAGDVAKGTKVVEKGVSSLPRPPTGPGSVPQSERDPQRYFDKDAREQKRADQGNICANGCGSKIDETNSAGHHVQRHADGGRTVKENHAEVCLDCHKNLHSKELKP